MEPPEPEPFLPAPQLPLSRLVLPITFEIEQMEEKVNSAVPFEVYRDDSYTNNNHDNLQMVILKKEDVEINMRGNELELIAPLQVWVQALIEQKVLGMKVKNEPDFTFAVKLHVRSKLWIDSKGELQNDSRLHRIEWIEEPTVQVAFWKIPVGSLAEDAIKLQEPLILRELNNAAKQHINVRKSILEAWAEIQKPILINKPVKKIWLTALPENLTVSPIHCPDGRNIILYAGIDAYLPTVVSDTMPTAIPKKLPKIIQKDQTDNFFDLTVTAALTYKELESAILDSVNKMELVSAGHNLKVKQVEVYGNGRKVVVGVKLAGDINGKVYLSGVPVFDSTALTLSFSELDYDVQTEMYLLNAASWIFEEQFLEVLKELMVMPLQERIEQVPERVREALANDKWGKKLDLQFKDFKLHPQAIVIRPEGIHTLVNVKGQALVKLEEL